MSRILYISAGNYDRKHLENSKIGLENTGIFFFQKSGNPGCAWDEHADDLLYSVPSLHRYCNNSVSVCIAFVQYVLFFVSVSQLCVCMIV